MSSIYSNEYQQVIQTLREIRLSKGITQQALANALNKPQSFVAKVENGERRLDVVEFMHIAQLLGTDPVKILDTIKIRTKKSLISEGLN